jgi:hypothetical protein
MTSKSDHTTITNGKGHLLREKIEHMVNEAEKCTGRVTCHTWGFRMLSLPRQYSVSVIFMLARRRAIRTMLYMYLHSTIIIFSLVYFWYKNVSICCKHGKFPIHFGQPANLQCFL